LSAAPDPNRWRALTVLGVAYLMVVLDVAIVNVALPSIQRDLHFGSESSLQWVVSGYTLTFGGLLLLGGRAGDILGRRRLFMVGLLLFSLCSLACGLATSAAFLVAARIAQGASGAILAPSVFSIVSVTFEDGPERNKALGILGAIAGAGGALGVLLGGILTEYAGWEWVFFVNVPIGLLALLVVPRVVHESKATHEQRFDAAGAVTVTGSLMLLVYGLTISTTDGWSSSRTIGVLVASAVLMAAFLVIESRSHSPLMPLSVFRRRTLAGANVIGFGLGTAVFGMFFLLSLYMQEVLGFSALRTGLGYLAVALTSVVAAGVAQALVTRLGVRPVLAFGLLMLAVGLAYFTRVSVDGSYAVDLLPGFLCVGVGLGFSFVPVSIAALAGISEREAGLASGLINTSQNIGGAVGLAILTTVSTTHTKSQIAAGVGQLQAAVDGFSLAFWVGAGFATAALIVTLVTLRGRELEAEAVTATPTG
jgi:EmrB/QacA subfamily drug resistance transporter